MKLIINVTRSDIKRGQRKSSYNCPIALAFHKFAASLVLVSKKQFVYLGHVYSLPRSARRFIDALDSGKSKRKLKPFRFRVEI